MPYNPQDRERLAQEVEALKLRAQSEGSQVEQLAAQSALSVSAALLLLLSQREQQGTA